MVDNKLDAGRIKVNVGGVNPPPPDGHRAAIPVGTNDSTYVSRRQAAQILGFASDFKVRQLEKAGRLQPTRGALGQAWYRRAEVLALADTLPGSAPGRTPLSPKDAPATDRVRPRSAGRWTDAALIAHLRGGAAGPWSGGPPPVAESGLAPLRTVVDLVADTGISITRAQRVYRFWLAHDAHPAAARARSSCQHSTATSPAVVESGSGVGPVLPPTPGIPAPEEKRASARLRRDVLIHQLRHPDPAARAAAFGELRTGRKSERSPSGRDKPPEQG